MPASAEQQKTSPHRPAWLAWGIGAAALLLVAAAVWGLTSLGWIPAPAFTETPSEVASQGLTITQQPLDTFQPTNTLQPTISATATSIPTPTLGIGSTWTRPADGMVMMYVPEGNFIMGRSDGTGNANEDSWTYCVFGCLLD